MSEHLEYVYVCKCEDGSISIINPNPKSLMEEEKWKNLHQIDGVENFVKLHPLQLPADRSKRDHWKLEDGKIIIEESSD